MAQIDSNTTLNQFMKTQIPVLIGVWVLFLMAITFLGSRSLLQSPIQPLYLVSLLILPSLLFLGFTLFGGVSLLAKLFTNIATILWNRRQKKVADASPSQNEMLYKGGALIDQHRHFRYFFSFIAHLSWSVIFTATLLSFALQFSLKAYPFVLSSTLFPTDAPLYHSLLIGIDALPALIGKPFGALPITEMLITESLNQTMPAELTAFWARWVLKMIAVYGMLPRVFFAIYHYIRFKGALNTALHEERRIQAQTPISHIKTLEKAQAKPVVSRDEKKTRELRKGSGYAAIALDMDEAWAIDARIQYLNTLETFKAFEERIQSAPLETLDLFIDASHTPDRGILRRITRLLNHTKTANLYCICQTPEESRFTEWHQKLTPLLGDRELLYNDLATFNPKENL